MFRPWGWAFAALVAPAAAAADPPPVPLTVVHHGRLLDGDDRPLTGLQQVAFSFFEVAARPNPGEQPLWSETYAVAVAGDGVFAVDLGGPEDASGATGKRPLDPDLFAPGVDRYLEIAVNGQVLSPRLKFGSAPYALRALDAIELGGRAAGEYALASEAAAKVGSVGVTPPLEAGGASTAPVLSLPSATAARDGYLAASDFAAFAGKQRALAPSPPLALTSDGALSIAAAGPAAAGALSASDWSRFDGKQDAFVADAPLALAGGHLTIPPADTNTAGALAAADFAAFDAKAEKTGEPGYIHNNAGSTPQAASFNVSGNGRVGGTFAVAGATTLQSVLFTPLSAAPTNPAEGLVYYDAGKHALRVYTGAAWADVSLRPPAGEAPQTASMWTYAGAGAPTSASARFFSSGGSKQFAVSTQNTTGATGSGQSALNGDNSTSQYWRVSGSNIATPQCLEFWFPAPAIIKTIRIDVYPQNDYLLDSYALERWTGSAWQAEVSYSGPNVNDPLITNTNLDSSKAANSWRIYFPPNASNTDVVHVTELTDFVVIE